jgi:superfamily I DNA/RNA helicase
MWANHRWDFVIVAIWHSSVMLSVTEWEARELQLPKPIGIQSDVLFLPAEGHTVVLGTAGSGKTNLAILRSAYLSDKETDHSGLTLLLSFNNTLITYIKHFLDDEAPNFVVETYHKFARGYLNSRGCLGYNEICDPKSRLSLINRALCVIRGEHGSDGILSRPSKLFAEEIAWISHHGIDSLLAYKNADRIGRSGTRITRADREIMYLVYEKYLEERAATGKLYDWDDLPTAVIGELDQDSSDRLYKHIVIDEGQDFTPQMLRSIVKAVPKDGSVTFFGDVAQQIYGNRMSWRDAGLQVSKVWPFTENYRNSMQIANLASALSKMSFFSDDADIVSPSAVKADGPLPTLVECGSLKEEAQLAVNQAVNAAKGDRVAILVKKHEDEHLITNLLPSDSICMDSTMNKWSDRPGIRYGTYHSAKGLEFGTVILPFCRSDRFPDPEQVTTFGEKEAMDRDGKLLYVGITRAKSRLIITYSEEMTALLPVDPNLYQRPSK